MEKKTMKKQPQDEARQNRINEIRKQLAEGTYQLDSEKLASALIKTMQRKSTADKAQKPEDQAA